MSKADITTYANALTLYAGEHAMNTRNVSQLLVITILAFGLVGTALAQAPEQAPLRPDDPAPLPPGRGFTPPTLELSHLTGENGRVFGKVMALPAQFDWRTQGKVTAVRNQGSCGACYAFAALANIEARLLIDGAGTFDLSENSLKECNYYGSSCAGGTYLQCASYLAETGTVLESCDPYVAADVPCNASCAYSKTLLDWCMISANATPAASVLKDYIYNYGPIYTTLFTGSASDPAWEAEFNGYDGTYAMHYAGTHTTNHAVCIVGWDDTQIHAGGSGAWIVKNSWGANWGGTCGYGTEGGYFYIAYGSANIGQYSSMIDDWQDYDANGDLLLYDNAGWTHSYGYGTNTAWAMAKFEPGSDVFISRVELWTTDVTTDVDVYIYDDFMRTTLLASKLNSAFPEAGYHSVALDTPLEVAGGNDVYAVVRITNNSYGYPIATDGIAGFVVNRTYMSQDGSIWYDMGANVGHDVGLRVRTIDPSLVVSVDDTEPELPDGYGLEQNYPNPFNPRTTIVYSLPHSSRVEIAIYNLLGEKVATVVDARKPAGEHAAVWNGRDSESRPVATGIYFYRIRTDEFEQTRKMLLLK